MCAVGVLTLGTVGAMPRAGDGLAGPGPKRAEFKGDDALLRQGMFPLIKTKEGSADAGPQEGDLNGNDARRRFPWWRLLRLDEVSDARCGGRDLASPLAWRMHYAGLHREAMKAISRTERPRVLIVEAAPGGGMGNQMMEPVNALFFSLVSSRALLFRTDPGTALDWFMSDWANWRVESRHIARIKGGGVRVHGARYPGSDVAIIGLSELADAYRELLAAGTLRGSLHSSIGEGEGNPAGERGNHPTRSTHFREGHSTFANQHVVAAVLAKALARPGIADKRAVILPGKFMHNLVVPQIIDLWEEDLRRMSDGRQGDGQFAGQERQEVKWVQRLDIHSLLMSMANDEVDRGGSASVFETSRIALLTLGPNGINGDGITGKATDWRRQGVACLFNTLYNSPSALLRPYLASYIEGDGPLGDPDAIIIGVHQRFGDHHLLFESFGGRDALDPDVLADIERRIGLNKYGEDNPRYSSLSTADKQLACAAHVRDELITRSKAQRRLGAKDIAPKAYLFLSSDSSAAANLAENVTGHDAGWSGGLLQTPGRPVHTVLTHKLFAAPTTGNAGRPNEIKSTAVANGLVPEDSSANEDSLGIKQGLRKAALDTWILALSDAVTRGPSSFSAAACYIAGQPRPSTEGIGSYPHSPDASMCVQATCAPIGQGFQGLVDDPDGDPRL